MFYINQTVAPHSIYWDLAIIKFVWPWKKQKEEGVDGISGDWEIRSNGTSPVFSNLCNRKPNICFSANTSVPCSRPVTPECPPNRTVSSLTSTWWSFCSRTHRCCHSPSIHTSGGEERLKGKWAKYTSIYFLCFFKEEPQFWCQSGFLSDLCKLRDTSAVCVSPGHLQPLSVIL